MNLKEQIAREVHPEDGDYPCAVALRRASSILSLILKEIEGVENPYAFQDGTAIPKWEKMFNAFEECRIAVKKVINAD